MSFDDQIRQALDRALTGVRGHLEADLHAFAHDLARAAAEERHRAVAQAAEAASADVRRQAQAHLAQLQEATQKHSEQIRRDAEAQTHELRRAMEEGHRVAEQEIATARSDATAARSDANAARSETEAARSETEAARSDAAAARSETDTVRREAEEVRSSAAAEARDAKELLGAQLATAAARAERHMADAMERTRTDNEQAMLAQAARLADSVRALDDAGAPGEALNVLSECAGREVDRAAVLLVRQDRLVGWRLSGFVNAPATPRDIELSFDEAGLPGAVVKTGIAISRPSVEPGPTRERQPALPPFAQDSGGRQALALPVMIGGTVVAVLYADAPRLDAPSASSRWPAVLDVLVRHASRTLEAMTVEQAMGLTVPHVVARHPHEALPGPVEQASGDASDDAARRYARILVSEIRMYNEPLVDAGRRSRDLLSRLSGEIARARRLYEARVPAGDSARSEYFDQELVRTLADGDQSLLGAPQ